MKYFQNLILIVIAISIHFACSKAENDIPDNSGTDSTYTQYGVPFESIPQTSDIVMYEVNLRAFSNTGDLQGVINRLDEIKALGVNVIWIMPIHPIGELHSVNSPYSVRNFYEVSPEYGTLEDLRELTDQAHARGMAVIMDWIANHTAWDNPWINNPGWYTQDANGNIVHPPGTNWHDVADLNFNNHNMRRAMIDAMKYWILEANVDGYRCDYADGVPFDFWRQAIDTLRAIPGRELVMLAEGERNDHFAAGFDLIWAWGFYHRLLDVYRGQPANILYTTHITEYNNVPEGRHRLRYTTNHDESAWEDTPMVLFNGKQGALAASVITIYMGGVPLFYTGQEVGRVNRVPFFSNSPIDWTMNPDMLQEYKDIMNVYVQSKPARGGNLLNHSTSNVVSFRRVSQNEELLVMVNVRNSSSSYSLPEALHSTTWVNTLTQEEITLEGSVELGNYQYYILRK